MTHTDVQKSLARQADPIKAIGLSRFFKTGPSQYGEGDAFIGLAVPSQRKIANTTRTWKWSKY